MSENQLASILNEMYENAPSKERVVHIHLFGIRYADEIKKSNVTPKEIIEASNLNNSYATEIGKGIKLSKYVRLL